MLMIYAIQWFWCKMIAILSRVWVGHLRIFRQLRSKNRRLSYITAPMLKSWTEPTLDSRLDLSRPRPCAFMNNTKQRRRSFVGPDLLSICSGGSYHSMHTALSPPSKNRDVLRPLHHSIVCQIITQQRITLVNYCYAFAMSTIVCSVLCFNLQFDKLTLEQKIHF